VITISIPLTYFYYIALSVNAVAKRFPPRYCEHFVSHCHKFIPSIPFLLYTKVTYIVYIIMIHYIRLCIPYPSYYSLCKLSQLEKLNIGGNPLNTVPEAVSSLTSPKELDMENCELSTLPERFVCHKLICGTVHYLLYLRGLCVTVFAVFTLKLFNVYCLLEKNRETIV